MKSSLSIVNAIAFAAVFVSQIHLMNSAVYRALQRSVRGSELGQLAFELTALIQFVAWTVFGFGWIRLPALALLLLPTLRELYDLLLIFVVRRARFADTYRRFIAGHHLNSLFARSLVATLAFFWMSRGAWEEFSRIQLLYYSCSAFLVAPIVVEKLLLSSAPPLANAASRMACFALARVTHFSVFLAFAHLAGNTLGAPQASLLVLLASVMMAANEYHSIRNGIPHLRRALRKTRASAVTSLVG